MWIVYKTQNKLSDKFYIGMHNNKYDDGSFDGYLGSSKDLINAINKYGYENFHRTTICICKDKKEAFIKEHDIMEYIGLGSWPSMYNLTIGGKRFFTSVDENYYPIPVYGYSNKGIKHSEQSKNNMRNGHLHKKLSGHIKKQRCSLTIEHKEKMSLSTKGRILIRKIDDHRIGKVLYPHQTMPDGFERGMMLINRNKK